MGSGGSRMGSGPSRRTRVRRGRTRLASFFCAASLPRDDTQVEEDVAEALFAHHSSSLDDPIRQSLKESTSVLLQSSSSANVNRTSGESSSGFVQETSAQYTLQDLETTDTTKYLSEGEALVLCQEDGCCIADTSHCEGSSHLAHITKEIKHPESAPVNKDVLLASSSGVNVAARDSLSAEHSCSTSMPQQQLERMHEDGLLSSDNHSNETLGISNSTSNSVSSVSNPSAIWHSLGDESIQDATPGFGFLLPTIQREQNGSVLHVDVVSISSSILPSSSGDISSREARRNSRRLFWDAFSRRSSRRITDSSTIVFSTEDTDDLGYHDRWLLDFSGELFDSEIGDDSRFSSGMRYSTYERRRQSRSEIWDRLRRDRDEHRERTGYCASGLHPDGTCSCGGLLMSEESITRASISRIVMLAEALFEVLDEIHRQPVSLSLSMLSVPAPESVVDSFPLKIHKKETVAENEDDVEQCYICLAEYNEGDQIRILPCNHEYHMSCVDKWLKEIHGVCPLCRRDVRGGVAESSVSNP